LRKGELISFGICVFLSLDGFIDEWIERPPNVELKLGEFYARLYGFGINCRRKVGWKIARPKASEGLSK